MLAIVSMTRELLVEVICDKFDKPHTLPEDAHILFILPFSFTMQAGEMLEKQDF
jgi:hypothetical protein